MGLDPRLERRLRGLEKDSKATRRGLSELTEGSRGSGNRMAKAAGVVLRTFTLRGGVKNRHLYMPSNRASPVIKVRGDLFRKPRRGRLI